MAEELKEWRKEVAKFVPSVPPEECDYAVLTTCIDFCGFTKLWKVRLTPIDIVVIEAATDIAFVSGSPCTITSTSTDFTAYFSAADIIVTDHQTSEDDESDNTGPFIIATDGVAANTITLDSGEALVSETAGDSTYISKAVYPLTSTDGDIVEVTKCKFDGETIDPKGEEWLDDNIPNWQTNMASAPTYFTVDQNRNLRLIPVPSVDIAKGLRVWVALRPLRTATSVEDFLFTDWMDTIRDGATAYLLSQTSKPWRDFKASNYYRKRYENSRYVALRRGRHGYSQARNNGLKA